MKVDVKVWTLQNGARAVRAATIEHGPRKHNPNCNGCEAICCRNLNPVLCQSELMLKQFKFELTGAPDYITKHAPAGKAGHHMVTLAKAADGSGCCFYLDQKSGRCRSWPDVPKACLAYDCREDDRPEIVEFVEQRKKEGTWK